MGKGGKKNKRKSGFNFFAAASPADENEPSTERHVRQRVDQELWRPLLSTDTSSVSHQPPVVLPYHRAPSTGKPPTFASFSTEVEKRLQPDRPRRPALPKKTSVFADAFATLTPWERKRVACAVQLRRLKEVEKDPSSTGSENTHSSLKNRLRLWTGTHELEKQTKDVTKTKSSSYEKEELYSDNDDDTESFFFDTSRSQPLQQTLPSDPELPFKKRSTTRISAALQKVSDAYACARALAKRQIFPALKHAQEEIDSRQRRFHRWTDDPDASHRARLRHKPPRASKREAMIECVRILLRRPSIYLDQVEGEHQSNRMTDAASGRQYTVLDWGGLEERFARWAVHLYSLEDMFPGVVQKERIGLLLRYPEEVILVNNSETLRRAEQILRTHSVLAIGEGSDRYDKQPSIFTIATTNYAFIFALDALNGLADALLSALLGNRQVLKIGVSFPSSLQRLYDAYPGVALDVLDPTSFDSCLRTRRRSPFAFVHSYCDLGKLFQSIFETSTLPSLAKLCLFCFGALMEPTPSQKGYWRRRPLTHEMLQRAAMRVHTFIRIFISLYRIYEEQQEKKGDDSVPITIFPQAFSVLEDSLTSRQTKRSNYDNRVEVTRAKAVGPFSMAYVPRVYKKYAIRSAIEKQLLDKRGASVVTEQFSSEISSEEKVQLVETAEVCEPAVQTVAAPVGSRLGKAQQGIREQNELSIIQSIESVTQRIRGLEKRLSEALGAFYMFEGNLAADPVALRITVHNRKIAKEATLPLRSILPSGVYQEGTLNPVQRIRMEQFIPLHDERRNYLERKQEVQFVVQKRYLEGILKRLNLRDEYLRLKDEYRSRMLVTELERRDTRRATRSGTKKSTDKINRARHEKEFTAPWNKDTSYCIPPSAIPAMLLGDERKRRDGVLWRSSNLLHVDHARQQVVSEEYPLGRFWLDGAHKIFSKCLYRIGKNFRLISSKIGGYSTQECVAHFYVFKHEFKREWQKRAQKLVTNQKEEKKTQSASKKQTLSEVAGFTIHRPAMPAPDTETTLDTRSVKIEPAQEIAAIEEKVEDRDTVIAPQTISPMIQEGRQQLSYVQDAPPKASSPANSTTAQTESHGPHAGVIQHQRDVSLPDISSAQAFQGRTQGEQFEAQVEFSVNETGAAVDEMELIDWEERHVRQLFFNYADYRRDWVLHSRHMNGEKSPEEIQSFYYALDKSIRKRLRKDPQGAFEDLLEVSTEATEAIARQNV